MSPAATWAFLLIIILGVVASIVGFWKLSRLDAELADLLHQDETRSNARAALARTGGER